MKKIMVAAAAVVLAMSLGGTALAEAKFGYVDVQKALNTSEAGKEAKEQLSAKVKKYQDEINVKQEELKKLKDELEKNTAILSESKKADKEKEYSQKLKDFQRFTKDAQEELQARDEEFTKKILEEFEKVVQEYGKKNGYTIIFARNDTMIFLEEKGDLTDDLVKAFNSGRKKK